MYTKWAYKIGIPYSSVIRMFKHGDIEHQVHD